ncbi:endonuclease III, partial [archaeon CG_4_10_14_0_2_um_filter_Archaea_38_6]
DEIVRILRKEARNNNTPVVELIEERSHDAFKVLASTILSARTKDETTMNASRRLFESVKNPENLAELSLKQIEELIYPVGFYRNKAKFLKKLPLYLGNGVPDTMDELVKIPGVGRKTANIVLSIAFNKKVIAVDTHVHRITNRWGLAMTKTPLETEQALMKKLPEKYWNEINYLLVSFGQNTCTPISPKCSKCLIYNYCMRVGVKKHR